MKTVKDLKPGDKLYSNSPNPKTIDVLEVIQVDDFYYVTIFCKGNTKVADVTTTWRSKGDKDILNAFFYVDPNKLIEELENTIQTCTFRINAIKGLQNE